MIRYSVIIRKLENGKFLLTYPDFKGMTSIAEKESAIEKLASSILQEKINELMENEVKIPKPMSAVEATKLLNHNLGEFITFVIIDGTNGKSIWEKQGKKENYKELKKELKHVKESLNHIVNKLKK